MSTVVLYHGFGVRGYRQEKTEVVEGRLVMRLSQSKESCRCSACGSREVVLSGASEREFRSVPIGRQPVTIVLPIPRVACQACGAVRQVAVTFAEPRRSYTKSFAFWEWVIKVRFDNMRRAPRRGIAVLVVALSTVELTREAMAAGH